MIEQVDLPDPMIFLEKLEAVDMLDADQVRAETKWLFRTARQFQLAVDSYTSENEYVEDPQIVADNLERFRRYSGALLGLTIALHRRGKFVIYEELTEESGSTDSDTKKKGLIQGDREQYARGKTAALEGLVRTVEEQHEALEGRVFRVGSRAPKNRTSYGD